MPAHITTAAITIAVIAILVFCALVAFGLWLGKGLGGGIGDVFDPWQ